MADWTDLIGPLLGTAGSIYTANQASNATTDAANAAAQASQFRPVGITTRFGKSGFQYDPATGQLTGAGYQVAPDVAAMREGLMGLAGAGIGQAQQAQAFQPQVAAAGQGLFNLGRQYVAQSPQEAAQQYMAQQQQLLAPGREQQMAQLTNQEQQRGRMGLATGATSAGYTAGAPGLQATNPVFAAAMNARAQQDAQLAAQAQQAGQQQVQFGQGLLGGGLNIMGGGYNLQTQALAPYTNYAAGATNLENQGLNALTQGMGLGSAITAGSTTAASLQNQAAQTAAALQQQRNNAVVGGLTDPISQLIKGLSSSNVGTGAAGNPLAVGAYADPGYWT
jgi:hypothetical protein